MPEGHTVHRIANRFNELFKGAQLRVDSPQGRFSDAKLIDGQALAEASAIGKQMFLRFENGLTLRVHLGIYGKWQFHEAGDLPQIVGQVRARFYANGHVVELRGPTVCEVIENAAVKAVRRRLGPDPLNPNRAGVESERFIQRVRSAKSSIGLLLMSQDVVAGIGNVYRAELLFRAEINPHTPGHLLTDEQLKGLWDDAVKLLKVGVKTSFMITREELFTRNPSKEDRNWVYKREGQPCRKCDTNIVLEVMAGRKLYWCPKCQR
jgi:endonuclease-8